MPILDRLVDACASQDHWLSFDLNERTGTYRIGNKTFHSVQKAVEEVDRLVKQRPSWALPPRRSQTTGFGLSE